MTEKLDAETKRLRKLLPGALADEAGALREQLDRIKDEAIRRGLRRAEGESWKLAMSPPSESMRTDKALLLQVMGISEQEYTTRFCHPVQTDYVLRVTKRKPVRMAEVEPVATAQRAA